MNYARLKAPMDDPSMYEFRMAMDPINALAKTTPGFVWSLDENEQDHPNAQVEEEEESGSVSSSSLSFGSSHNNSISTSLQRDAVPLLQQDPLLMPQLSLWQDMASLQHFAFQSGHAMYLKRKRLWFTAPCEPPWAVCWWWKRPTSSNDDKTTTPRDGIHYPQDDQDYPTLKDAFDRLAFLQTHGPTAWAFDFRSYKQFPMPDDSDTDKEDNNNDN